MKETVNLNTRTIIQTINMLSKNTNMQHLNREKLELLFWVIDRLHVRHSGRSLTKGTYVQLVGFPTTILMLNLIYQLGDPQDPNSIYFNENVIFDDEGMLQEVRDNQTDYLSEVNIMLINKVADHFGDYTVQDMIELVQQYPEAKYTGSMNIDMQLFFENPGIENDFFQVDQELLEAAKWTYNEIEQLSKDTGINFHTK